MLSPCRAGLAAPDARVVQVSHTLKSKRAQGMPGEGLTHGPRAIKKHGKEPQVQPIIRHSLRDGLTAYGALSLGTGLYCPHRPQRSSRSRAWPQRREART